VRLAPPPLDFVDKIVLHEIRRGNVRYLVRWQGYTAADDTWESGSTFITQHGGRIASGAAGPSAVGL